MRVLTFALLTSCLLLSGCGSMLASLQVDTIEDEPGYRTFGRIIEDDQVETKAIVNIHAANDLFHEAHITVVSYNGYLLLAGQVPNEAMKVQATEVVHKIKGVRRIYNELEIAAPSSGMTRTSDTWITAKVKSLLLGSSEIQGSRVKVVTENGVVFLMGLASSREAQRVADTASGISGAQRVVRLFELLE